MGKGRRSTWRVTLALAGLLAVAGRAPGLAATGVVYSLPAGMAMRYAAVVAGNDGLDVPECAYDRAFGQVDALAGLTEAGTGLCAAWGTDVVFLDGFEECSL